MRWVSQVQIEVHALLQIDWVAAINSSDLLFCASHLHLFGFLSQEPKSSGLAVFPEAFPEDLERTDFRLRLPRLPSLETCCFRPELLWAPAASSHFRQESLAARAWRWVLKRLRPTARRVPTRDPKPSGSGGPWACGEAFSVAESWAWETGRCGRGARA
nr:uncharacterized protein LOC112428258 [Macaca nemestrina]